MQCNSLQGTCDHGVVLSEFVLGWWNFWDLTLSDGVAVVSVAARVAVGVEPVLHVGLLGPLVQSLHVEQVLLS